MKVTKKLLSLLLVLVLMCTSMAGYSTVIAEAQANVNQISDTVTNDAKNVLNQDVNGNTNLDKKDNVIFEELRLPDIVKKEAGSSQYISRAKSKEKNLNTFVFKNKDGTQTMKVYSYPVKYIDEKGNVQDISTDIKVNENGSFETKANSIKTTFSKRLKEGITLTHNNVNIRLATDKTSEAIISQDKKTVSYVYDNKTTIEYSLTYTGFKEDIVVNEYTGQTEYEFTLYTNGLTLVKEYGSYFLKDSRGNIKATLGDIIIFTADEKNNTFGDMTHETITPNQEYVITIHVDSEYLKDPKTKYPIRIDPTIEINYDDSGAGAIEDVTISQGTTYGGTSGSLYIGRNADGTLSRALMRFPTLNLTGISASQITNAYVELRDLMCQGDEPMIIECRPYLNSAPSWSEAQTVTWNSVGTNYYGAVFDSHEVLYGQGNAPDSGSIHRYRFDLTSLAQDWANGIQSATKGIVLKATDSFESQTGSNIQYWKKTFASYNRAANKPLFSLTYTPTISITVSETSVVEGDELTLTATGVTGQIISWTSSNTSVATVNSSGMVTGIKAGSTVITATIQNDNNETISDTCVVYVRIADGVYYFENISGLNYLYVYGILELVPVCVASINTNNLYEHLKIMWKIKYLSHGMYSVRPMHMLTTGLGCYENGRGILIDIGTEDTYSAVGPYARWSIKRSDDCVSFFLDGDEEHILQLYGQYTTDGTPTVVGELVPGYYTHEWFIEEVDNPPEGIFMYNTLYEAVFINPLRILPKNTNRSLSDMNLHPAVYSANTIEQDIYWSSNNISVASVGSTSGTVTTHDVPGIAVITGTVTIGNATYSTTFRVEVLDIEEGRYYIRNYDKSKTIQINNSDAPGYNTSGATVEQWDVDEGNYQKWDIIPIGNGYYKIISAQSGLALSVPSGWETKRNASVIQETYNGYDRQKWSIRWLGADRYKIKSKAAESSSLDLVLSSEPLINPSEGTAIIQETYIEGSYLCEWQIIKPEDFSKTYYIVNYYDSSVENSEQVQNFFAKVTNTVAKCYKHYFDINLVMVDGGIPYNSIADQCPLGDNAYCNGSCQAGSEYHSQHHKDIVSMSDQLYNEERKDNHIYILWNQRDTRVYCTHEDGAHRIYEGQACVVEERPIITVLNKLSVGNEWYFSLILIHEIAHTFGIEDRYNISTHAENGAQHKCVMENLNPTKCDILVENKDHFVETTLVPELFCSVCENDLARLIDKFHMNNIE